MRTALDSSVILDVLTDDERYGALSEQAIRRASEEGALLVGEQVLAEIVPVLPPDRTESVSRWLQDWNIETVPADREVAVLAGSRYGDALHAAKADTPVLTDFLIGAHAYCRADRLLARPAHRWKQIINELEVIEP